MDRNHTAPSQARKNQSICIIDCKLVVLAFTSLLAGCSFITSKDVHTIPDEASADEYIRAHEEGTLPPEHSMVRSLGLAYAVKSVHLVHRESGLSYSGMMGGLAGEFILQTDEPSAWTQGLPYLLLTPVAFMGDVLVYPKKVIDNFSVSREDYDKAMGYMKLARENGYKEKYMNMIPYYPIVRHIDVTNR